MKNFCKVLLFILTFNIIYINYSYSDYAIINFYKANGIKIGSAEGVDSWFLNAPSFKFNLSNLESGLYRIALYDGESCINYGAPAEIKNPKLNSWKPSHLLALDVKNNGIFDTTLGIKPIKFTEETRGLISIGSLRGSPLLIFKDNEKHFIGCGMVPLLLN